MLANFEELVLRCADETSRSHIREAIRCYDAGAFRSAIVASYIAVSFDLIEKLRSLAAAKDGEAQVMLAELKALQNKQLQNDLSAILGLLKFERDLPKAFRDKFEFFGVIEFEDVQRLVVDRNRCAHPSFIASEEPYHPTAEVARLHIRNALDLVLTQEPKQGKSALETLRNIVLSSSFPKDEDEIRIRLEASPIGNARPALIRGFIDETTFGIATKDSKYFKKAAAAKAAEATAKMHPDVGFKRYFANVSKMLLDVDPDALRYGAMMALRSPDVGNALSDASKSPVKAYVINPTGSAKANALQRALRIEWLKDFAKEHVKLLNPQECALASKPPHPDILERAVELIIGVKNYEVANKTCGDLLEMMRYLSVSQIRRILDAAQSGVADLKGAFGFEAILQVIAHENSIGKLKLVALLAEYEIDEPDWVDPTAL